MDWFRASLLVISIFGVIAISEIFRRIFKLDPEVTRKVVHISVGIAVFPAPIIFSSLFPVIAIALFFIAVNFLSLRMRLFKGMDSVERQTFGTVYYPLAFLILVLVFWKDHPAIISISMLTLALGDALAAIVGEGVKNPNLYNLTGDKKSIQGSTAMFLTTMLIVAISLYFTSDSIQWWGKTFVLTVKDIILIALLTALFTTVFEAIGSYGFDNLFIPISSSFMLYSLVIMDRLNQFLIAFALAILIAVISYKLKFLSLNGAVGTFILAVIIFGVGGWRWTLPILIFFVLSSLISKIGKRKKENFEFIFEKSSTRDFYQVMANGGIAGLIAVIYQFSQNEIFYFAYLGSISAATFDTWATEIGTLFSTKPRLLTNFKRVEPGTSGAVSLKGSLGGLIGSIIIFSSAMLWIKFNFAGLLVVVLSGLFGGFVDSFLGSTLQAQYRCNVCSKTTEKKFHCGNLTSLVRGKRWINNDFVNFACTSAGALSGLILMII